MSLWRPEPTEEEYEQLYRDLTMVQEELSIANQTLERHRRFLDQLRAWTRATDDLAPPPYCGDVYRDGVREMKAVVRQMLQDLEK